VFKIVTAGKYSAPGGTDNPRLGSINANLDADDQANPTGAAGGKVVPDCGWAESQPQQCSPFNGLDPFDRSSG